jgi:prophage regulatory protein
MLSYDDLRERGIPYSKSHIDLLVERDQFPKPVRLGKRRVGWTEEEVERWFQDRIAERDGGTRRDVMAKVRLTSAAVANYRPDVTKILEISDALVPGLRLLVHPSGNKSWAMRFRLLNGRITDNDGSTGGR